MKTEQKFGKKIMPSLLSAFYFAIAVFLAINVKSLPTSRKGWAFLLLSLSSLWVSIELANMKQIIATICIYGKRK